MENQSKNKKKVENIKILSKMKIRGMFSQLLIKNNNEPGNYSSLVDFFIEANKVSGNQSIAMEMWEKGNDYPHFRIRNHPYKVIICDICKRHLLKGYGIVDEVTGERVDCEGIKGYYYLD